MTFLKITLAAASLSLVVAGSAAAQTYMPAPQQSYASAPQQRRVAVAPMHAEFQVNQTDQWRYMSQTPFSRTQNEQFTW